MKQQTNQVQKQKEKKSRPREDRYLRQLKEINKAWALQVNALANEYFAAMLPVGQTKMVSVN
jgi:phage-related minor tail protein